MHADHYKNGKVDRKAECDAMLTWNNESGERTVIKSSMVGTVYYAAVKHTKPDGTFSIWAAAFLTGGGERETPYFNFGYKDMDETVEPYYYDCPKSILDLLTPTDNESANIWRQKCWIKQNMPKIKDGDIVKFDKPISFTDGSSGDTFQKVSYGNRRGVFKELKSGQFVRISGYQDRKFEIITTASKSVA